MMTTSCRSRHLRKLKETMARTSIAFLLLAVLASASTYTHKPEGLTYYTFRCPDKWCGVDNGRWPRRERILYYNYTMKDDIVIKNVTEVHQKADCTGSLSSDGCNITNVIEHNNEEKVRDKIVVKGAEPYKVIPLPESLSLGLIFTDNFNASGHLINETYPLNQDKIWQMTVPKGCRMNVYFRVFDLEGSSECKKDNFTVQTSKSQTDIHKYCHNLEEIEIRRRRRVQMTMHSDEDITSRGIYATVCISNLPEDRTINQDPCTCLQSNIRQSRRARARRVRSAEGTEVLSESEIEYRNLVRMRIEEEDRQVAEWLRILMRDGQSAIDEFIANPVSEKQRRLALKYQQAVELAEDERTSLQ